MIHPELGHLLPDVPEVLRIERGTSMWPWEGDISSCRKCGKPVAWIKTPAGKNLSVSVMTSVSCHGKLYAKCHFEPGECRRTSGEADYVAPKNGGGASKDDIASAVRDILPGLKRIVRILEGGVVDVPRASRDCRVRASRYR